MSLTDPTIKQLERFTVTGFQVRTRNSEEFQAESAKLPGLWQQCHAKIPGIEPVFGVYSDYESDANGAYSVTAGVSMDTQGSGLTRVEVQAGNYLVFQGQGPMPMAIIDTWKRVWDYFASEKPWQRCFMTDFEAYGDGDSVAIYIGVKQEADH